jgi:hypothetical protein
LCWYEHTLVLVASCRNTGINQCLMEVNDDNRNTNRS